MRPDSRGLVTFSAAAERLSVSRRSLYRLNERGVLPFLYLSPDMPRVRQRDLASLGEDGAWPGTSEIAAVIREGTRALREEDA